MTVDITKPLNQMTESELDVLASHLPENKQPEEPGTLESIGAGVVQGSTVFARKSLALAQSVVDKLDFPTIGAGEGAEATRAQTAQLREKFAKEFEGNLLARGTAFGTELAGDIGAAGGLSAPVRGAAGLIPQLGKVSRLAGGMARDVAGAGVISGLNDQSFGQTALTSLLVGAPLRVLGGLRPTRTSEVSGLSRAQVLGKDTRPEALRQLGNRISKLKGRADDLFEQSDDLGTKLIQSHEKIAAGARSQRDKLFKNVFKGTDEVGKVPFSGLADDIDDVLRSNRVSSENMSPLVREFVETAKKVPNNTLREADAIVTKDLSKILETIQRGERLATSKVKAGDLAVVSKVKALVRTRLDDELTKVGKGEELAKARKFFIEKSNPILKDRELNKVLSEGHIDDVTRVLLTPSKEKLVPKVFEALDDGGKRALESGLIKKLIAQKSIDEVVNPKQVATALSKLRGPVSSKFTKDTTKILDGISKLNNAMLKGRHKVGISDVMGPFRNIAYAMLDSKAGIKLLTKAGSVADDSPVFSSIFNAMIDTASRELTQEADVEPAQPFKAPSFNDLVDMPDEEFAKFEQFLEDE